MSDSIDDSIIRYAQQSIGKSLKRLQFLTDSCHSRLLYSKRLENVVSSPHDKNESREAHTRSAMKIPGSDNRTHTCKQKGLKYSNHA